MRKLSMSRAPASRAHWRTALYAAVVALLAGVCAACGGSPGEAAGPSPKAGGELIWGKPAEATLLDPAPSGSASAWELLQLTYERLVSLDDGFRPVPELAESWEQTSPTSYVFTLRKGVKFSNGRELTADDVVGTFERIADPKLASTWAVQLGIKTAEASGTSQVKVTLKAPRTSFIAALAHTQAAILPIRELKAGTFDPKKELLGTGPFKVSAHSQDESWTFVRNPYYWRAGLPKVDKLTVRIMLDDAARAAALRNGSIHVTTFSGPDSIRLLKGQAGVKTVVQATTDYYKVSANAKSSIFSDDRLRQALSLAIDRNRIRDVALGGVGRPTAAVPAAFGGVCDPAAMPYGTPDVARARQLVTEAGATGKNIEIVSLPVVPMAASIAQVLQQNLQAAGFKVTLKSLETGVALKQIYSGKKSDFDLIVSWYAGYGDPGMVLPWWDPAVTAFAGGYEKSDPQLNTLIEKSLSTAAGPERTAAMTAACRRVAENANVIPLISKDAIVAYRSDEISVQIPKAEGYAVPLRRIAEFGLNR